MSGEIPADLRGPIDDQGEYMFNQERLARDYDLTQRIQAGYTPPQASPENPRPRFTDGNLDPEAQIALSVLHEAYAPIIQRVVNNRYNFTFNNPIIDKDDLMSYGFFGFYHSALVWHPEMEITFLTHVTQYVDNFVKKEAGLERPITHIPTNVHPTLRHMERFMQTTIEQHDRWPTDTELVEELGVSMKELKAIKLADKLSRIDSIDKGYMKNDHDERDARHLNGGEGTWEPITPNATTPRPVDEEALLSTLEVDVAKALEVLPDREQTIIKLRYLIDEPLTLEQVGKEMGLTRERIRQIEARALSMLRGPKHSGLLAYLNPDRVTRWKNL